MKQLISALLTLLLALQPLFGQTTPQPLSQASPKPAKEDPAEIVPMEELLPADTLAYVASSNLAGLLHSFERLDAFQVARARLPKEEKESAENPLAVATRFLSFGIADSRALEDARIGFALVAPDLPKESETETKPKPDAPPVPAKMPEPMLLVFVEGVQMEPARKARDQFLTYYNETFQPIGKLSEIKQVEYKGAKVDRFKTGEVGMWFGATYVLSQTAALDRLMNLRADRRAERLADDQAFIRTKTQMMPQTGLFAYLNGKPLQQFLGTAMGRGGGGLDFFLSSMFGADTIRSAALASTFEREGVVDRLVLNLVPGKTDFLSAFFSAPKGEFKAARFIPPGTEIVVSHHLDWVKIYDTLLVNMFYREMARAELMAKYQMEQARKEEEARANKQPLPPQNMAQLRQRIETELTAEKLAKAVQEREASVNQELGYILRDEAAKDLGNEVAVAYGIPRPVAPIVVPTIVKDGEEEKKNDEGWAVFLGIKDRAATQKALISAFAYLMGGMGATNISDEEEPDQKKPPKTEEQLKQEREARLKNAQSAWAMMPSEVYKKVEIKSVFAAHLGFSDEYLIVADSKETIKQMLDLSESDRALPSDANYSRAMSNLGASSVSKVFIGPQMFDGLLNGFLQSWVTNPNLLDPDPSAKAPLNIPATAAATIENDNGTIKLELFSPLGIAGTFALWAFGSDVQRTTERAENQARQQLWELRKAEKLYAKKNDNKYADLETLAKARLTVFDAEKFKREEGNYKFTFKLKTDGKGYEATATPIKYGREGRKAFFLDETDKLRMTDKPGAVATASDEVIEERVFGEEDTAGEGIKRAPAVRRNQ